MCLVQAVPVAQAHSSQYYPQQAVFALNEASGRLYAAGGAAPSTVHTWDMSQECCTQQVSGLMHYILLRLIICSTHVAMFLSRTERFAPAECYVS